MLLITSQFFLWFKDKLLGSFLLFMCLLLQQSHQSLNTYTHFQNYTMISNIPFGLGEWASPIFFKCFLRPFLLKCLWQHNCHYFPTKNLVFHQINTFQCLEKKFVVIFCCNAQMEQFTFIQLLPMTNQKNFWFIMGSKYCFPKWNKKIYCWFLQTTNKLITLLIE